MLQFLDPALLRMARADEEAIRRLAMVILVVGLGDKLPPEALVQHSTAVFAKLEDSDMYVRSAAVATLGKLGWL